MYVVVRVSVRVYSREWCVCKDARLNVMVYVSNVCVCFSVVVCVVCTVCMVCMFEERMVCLRMCFRCIVWCWIGVVGISA